MDSKKILRLPETCSQHNPRKGRVKNRYGNKPSKWRWPQKRYGTPEKPSLKSQDWNLDQTRSQWTIYGWEKRRNSIQRRKKRKVILGCVSLV